MQLLALGGPVMWILLGVSVVALAVIIERCIVFSKLTVPQGLTPLMNAEEVSKVLQTCAGLEMFATAVAKAPCDKAMVGLAGQSVIDTMEVRLDLLGALAKFATLLGLLGTVLGMIETFSAIASSSGGIDMMALAQGLWQALLTTAAGLTIAIPSGLALVAFEGRVARMSQALTLAANRVVAGDAS